MSKFCANIFLIQSTLELLLVLSRLQNSNFPSQISTSKIHSIHSIILSRKIWMLGAHFSLLTFFENFKALYFQNLCPIFVGSEVFQSGLHQKILLLNLLIIYLHYVRRLL